MSAPDTDIAERVARRVVASVAAMIHGANHRPGTESGDAKVGGHPAACTSAVHILTALHLFARRPEDTIAGKPHGAAVDLALEVAASAKEKVALIGDSLPNDGRAARHIGVPFVLVLTGVSTAEDEDPVVGPPDHIYATLSDASSYIGR